MTHKIAIAISGAVSLGSYEAGTVYELIHAVKQHNQANPDNRIEIDVLSGASAGGMTAAMIAQKLLFDGPALEAPNENCLHEIWVNRVDITDLLNPDLGDDPKKSLLSSNHIANNAKYVFLTRYQKDAPEVIPHAAAGKSIQLGLALSNLNGVDYELSTFSQGSDGLAQGRFVQTRNQDRYTCVVNKDSDNPAYWSELMTAGMACGAFPLAFRPVKVQRQWDCQDYKGLGAKSWYGLFDGQFNYADGGIFNNSPLGLARELALRVDKGVADADKRYYFYISPHKKSSTADYTFDEEKANMISSLGQITKCILNNSGFQDWVQTDSINNNIDKLHQRAQSLLEVVLQADVDELKAMSLTTNQFCKMLYAQTQDSIENGASHYDADVRRAEDNFMRYVPTGTTLTQQQKTVWLNAILIMEVNASLSNKDKMRIYTITANNSELAGSPIASFFGFLDVRFRKHDYLLGRLKAREMLNDIIHDVRKGDESQLPLNIDLLDTQELENALKPMLPLRKATMIDVAIDTRKKLYTRLKKSSVRILKSVGMNSLICWVIVTFVLRHQLRKFLHL